MAKKCSMCGASLKLDAKECEYCGTNVYEDEKDKYVKENYANNQNSSTSNGSNIDEEKIQQIEARLRMARSSFRPNKHFNTFLFIILFMFVPPFAIIYLILNFSGNSNNHNN